MENHWVGNTFGAPEEHVQNFVEAARVDPDGSVWTRSFWDEGGASESIYKDGRRIRRMNGGGVRADSATHPVRGTWIIRNLYGRAFLAKIAPPPTGDSAPWIQGPGSAAIRSVTDPTALGFLPDGRLLVGDNGPDQNVKIFDVSDPSAPKLVGTFGDSGGVFAGPRPGAAGPKRFWGIRGVGSDSLGRICVAGTGMPMQVGGGTDIRCFTGWRDTSTLRWQVQGLSFVNSADFDPDSAGTSVFLNAERFHMDWSKPARRSSSFVAATIDPFRYPSDPRLTISMESVFVRRIQGKLFLFVTDMYSKYLAVIRFEEGSEIGIPCAFLPLAWSGLGDDWAGSLHPTWDASAPANISKRWLWVDRDGDGSPQASEFQTIQFGYPFIAGIDVSESGHIVLSGKGKMTMIRLPGLDAKGIPQYSASSIQVHDVPFKDGEGDVPRLKYLDREDVMILSAAAPTSKGYMPDLGFRIEAWSDSAHRRISRFAIPYRDGGPGVEIRLDVNTGPMVLPWSLTADKDYVYVAYLDRGPHARVRGEITVIDSRTGRVAGYLSPGPETSYANGAVDLRMAVNVLATPTGERLVSLEDDGAAKVQIYRFCPPGEKCAGSGPAARAAEPDIVRAIARDRNIEVEGADWTRARLFTGDGAPLRTWDRSSSDRSLAGLPPGVHLLMVRDRAGRERSTRLVVLP